MIQVIQTRSKNSYLAIGLMNNINININKGYDMKEMRLIEENLNLLVSEANKHLKKDHQWQESARLLSWVNEWLGRDGSVDESIESAAIELKSYETIYGHTFHLDIYELCEWVDIDSQ